MRCRRWEPIPSRRTGPGVGTVIEVRDLSKEFGRKQVLNGVSFDVKRGAITGFLGPNGAGKSTTMKIMVGLESPTRGEVLIGGKRYADLDNPSRTVACLIDAAWMDRSLTVRQYVTLAAVAQGYDAKSRSIMDAISQVGMESAANRRISMLSLGMRQRVGLAGCLIGQPKYLILDEPINGLDPDGIIWFRGTLRRLTEAGCGILLSSHLMSELEDTADNIVLISEGSIKFDEPMDTLQRTAGGSVRVRVDNPAALITELALQPDAWHESAPNELVLAGVASTDVFKGAVSAGVVLEEMYVVRRSLEDVYMDVVGRSHERVRRL
ncbi:ABC transporter ATP-binding protein [Microlunatus sp. GCM10028923]|uniref:ABC transporter ATP-binding protein n=1 Tax=Microlunatus sp. GCM10028923 TaxID=3273400 RepID=UPI00361B3AEB